MGGSVVMRAVLPHPRTTAGRVARAWTQFLTRLGVAVCGDRRTATVYLSKSNMNAELCRHSSLFHGPTARALPSQKNRWPHTDPARCSVQPVVCTRLLPSYRSSTHRRVTFPPPLRPGPGFLLVLSCAGTARRVKGIYPLGYVEALAAAGPECMLL